MIENLNGWADVWAGFMWRGVVEGSLLLAILLIVWLPLRRRMPAQVAYCLFLLVLLKVCTPVQLPVPAWLAYASPRYSLEMLANWATTTDLPHKLLGGRDTGAATPSHGLQPLDRSSMGQQWAAEAAALQPTQVSEGTRQLSRNAWLMLAWLAVVVGLVVGLALVQKRMQRVIEKAAPVDAAALRVDFESLMRRAGVRQRVGIVAPSAIGVPAVWGLVRPRIVMPRELLGELTANQLTFVLLHELTHIRRGDLFVALLQRLVQIAFFFHPAVWIANWLIDQQREYACDDAALAACSFGRRDCGQGFLRIVEFASAQPMAVSPALGLCSGWSSYKALVRSRLMRILDTKRSIPGRISALSMAVLMVLACVLLPRLEAQQAKQKEAEKAAVENSADGKSAVGKSAAEKPVANDDKGLSYQCAVVEKGTGKGVAGATVTVQRMDMARRDKIVAETKYLTDAEGKFTLEIPPEQAAMKSLYIQVLVEHGDYVRIPGIGYSLAMIRKNETHGERPFFERLELEAADKITGRVVDPSGQPVAGVEIAGFTTQKTDDQNQRRWLEMKTGADGRFQLNQVKGGVTYFSVNPQDFAIVERLNEGERGDLGDIRLSAGARISGRVLTLEGKPAVEVLVNARSQGQRNETLGNFGGPHRTSLTDAKGEFSLAPLPPGEYEVDLGDHTFGSFDPPKGKPLPGAFVGQTVVLQEGDAKTLEIRGVPTVRFHAQWLTSDGKKTDGHDMPFWGRVGEKYWMGSGRVDDDGAMDILIPRGLRNVQINLITNEHTALRHRLGPGKPLQNQQHAVHIDRIDEDIDGFEIVEFKAPVVAVRGVDETGRQVKELQIVAEYAWLADAKHSTGYVGGWHFRFERQDDGQYRSSQMLPDEETTITVSAKGYQPVSEKLKLREGETKELVVTLKAGGGGKE